MVLLTLVEFAPIKINPWSALANAIGRAVNADVLRELKSVKDDLSDHIRMDDERNADEHRARILRFNNELLRDIPHTKEEFIDVLADIDFYERYCDEHKGYKITERNTLLPISAGSTMTGSGSMTFEILIQ